MNGIIRCWPKGLLVLTAMIGGTGCLTLPTTHRQCGHCSSGPTAGPCQDGHCGRCARCDGSMARLKDKMRCFDWEQLHDDHCWPEQFARESKRRINESFGQQMHNGNLVESTIWNHYFQEEPPQEPETSEDTKEQKEAKEVKKDVRHVLNPAGHDRLRYLSHRRPYVRPDLYLQTSYDDQLDQQRKQSILDALKGYSKYSPDTIAWRVTVVDREPIGLPGIEGVREINTLQGTAPILRPHFEPILKTSFNAGSGGLTVQ